MDDGWRTGDVEVGLGLRETQRNCVLVATAVTKTQALVVLHLIDDFDPQQFESVTDRSRGQIAERISAVASFIALGLHDRTILVKRAVLFG